jgi:hypothetical protein
MCLTLKLFLKIIRDLTVAKCYCCSLYIIYTGKDVTEAHYFAKKVWFWRYEININDSQGNVNTKEIGKKMYLSHFKKNIQAQKL